MSKQIGEGIIGKCFRTQNKFGQMFLKALRHSIPFGHVDVLLVFLPCADDTYVRHSITIDDFDADLLLEDYTGIPLAEFEIARQKALKAFEGCTEGVFAEF